jgi:hypothetical protein
MRTATFIDFFVEVAQQKLTFRYSIVKLILHKLPAIKPSWKTFELPDGFSLKLLKAQYPGLDVREYRFIYFIICGYLKSEEMAMIMHLHSTLNFDKPDAAYSFTHEELHYYSTLVTNDVTQPVQELIN